MCICLSIFVYSRNCSNTTAVNRENDSNNKQYKIRVEIKVKPVLKNYAKKSEAKIASLPLCLCRSVSVCVCKRDCLFC